MSYEIRTSCGICPADEEEATSAGAIAVSGIDLSAAGSVPRNSGIRNVRHEVGGHRAGDCDRQVPLVLSAPSRCVHAAEAGGLRLMLHVVINRGLSFDPNERRGARIDGEL
jgi:hypothetical protein